jgi:hypothetical protein
MSDRCPSTHNPGIWPHVARCVRPAGHPPDGLMGHMDELVHVDGHGQTWAVDSQSDTSVLDLPHETARVVLTPEDARDELTKLECGHCGDVSNVSPVVFPEGPRYLCRSCRTKVLAWI